MKRTPLCILFCIAFLCPASFADDNWQSNLAGGIALAFLNSQVEFDDWGKYDLDGSGIAFTFECRLVYEPTGFCIVAKGGGGSFESNNGDFDGDFSGTATYFMVGAGRRFGFRRLSLIPAVGLGLSYLEAETDFTSDGIDYDYEITQTYLTLCADLCAQLMFSERFGLSASILATFSYFGSGKASVGFRDYSFSADFDVRGGTWSFIPSICLNWRI